MTDAEIASLKQKRVTKYRIRVFQGIVFLYGIRNYDRNSKTIKNHDNHES